MSNIVGQDTAERAFVEAMQGPRMHHAWLFAGPEGVGKASIAKVLARRMLCEAASSEAVGKLFDAHTHPDFVAVERLPKDAKAVRDLDPREWPADLERARNITVDQVRALGAAFALKPALSPRRAVLIDAVDDLERGAANALLKSLEEPPAGTIFLLVSHAPGRLLPTIRSRCRTLRFAALGENEMRLVLRRELPPMPDAELAALIEAGQGSPGRALAYAGLDLAGLDLSLARLARDGDPSNALSAELAQSLSLKASQKRFEAFLARVPAFLATQARGRSGAALETALDAWARARNLAESAVRQSLDPHMTAFALARIVASLAGKGEAAKA